MTAPLPRQPMRRLPQHPLRLPSLRIGRQHQPPPKLPNPKLRKIHLRRHRLALNRLRACSLHRSSLGRQPPPTSPPPMNPPPISPPPERNPPVKQRRRPSRVVDSPARALSPNTFEQAVRWQHVGWGWPSQPLHRWIHDSWKPRRLPANLAPNRKRKRKHHGLDCLGKVIRERAIRAPGNDPPPVPIGPNRGGPRSRFPTSGNRFRMTFKPNSTRCSVAPISRR